MREEVTPIVKYGGIDIAYDEQTNKWVFELDGKERKADSLTNAKKTIDKPIPVKKKPFERFEVYKFMRWTDDKYVKVTVTSVAETPSYTSQAHFWIVDGKGNREKVGLKEIFEVSPENEARIKVINQLMKDIAVMNQKLEAEHKKLLHPPYEPNKEGQNET